MTTPDPAATLRAAAARLRALAAGARSTGPYSVKGQCLCDRWDEDVPRCESREHRAVVWHVRSAAPPGSSWISHQVVETNHEGDARWLALLSPQVAEPLAAWLEEAAQSADIVRGSGYSVRENALAFARAVLGDAPADAEGGA